MFAAAQLRARRLLLALYAPVRLVYALFELRLRLRANPAMRTEALGKAEQFSKLLAELPTSSAQWLTRLERKAQRWSGRGIVVVRCQRRDDEEKRQQESSTRRQESSTRRQESSTQRQQSTTHQEEQR